jgi:Asp/Glu/hydantoin racemase
LPLDWATGAGAGLGEVFGLRAEQAERVDAHADRHRAALEGRTPVFGLKSTYGATFFVKKLLLLNPNTTPAITERLRARVQHTIASQWTVEAITAAFGMPYIADESSYAIAAHATLQAYTDHVGQADAMLVGCFGDPGGFALRADGRMPSVGLAEAAMREAAALGPYAIVTGGAAWKPMLERLAYGLGGAVFDQLARIETITLTGAQIANDPQSAHAMLLDACLRAHEHAPATRSVILGGAGLMGIAETLQPSCPVRLIDSVDAGARAVLQFA